MKPKQLVFAVVRIAVLVVLGAFHWQTWEILAEDINDLPPAQPGGEDWPWWRGPTGNNLSAATDVPLHWSTNQNVVWKVSIPGRGHASPTIWGDRIFIATADEQDQVLALLGLDRSTGKKLWTAQIHKGGFLKKHENNSHASATPACDGERIFFPALFDNALWLRTLNFQGKVLWQKKIGRFVSVNGYGSSPVLYKSAVIVVSDNTGEACLVALHRRTGKVLWRVDRPGLDNFCTPALGHVSGRMQLLLQGSRMIASYDPESGHELWRCDSPTEVTASTVAFGTNVVVASGNIPVREMIAIRADGSGNVTRSNVVWRTGKNVTYVPSPIIRGDRLFFVNDSGVAHCLELQTGKEIWKERLGGDFFASPVLAANRIYMTNKSGRTYVLKAADQFEILAENSLEEETFASPVISGHRLFLRTKNSLFCIGTRTAP